MTTSSRGFIIIVAYTSQVGSFVLDKYGLDSSILRVPFYAFDSNHILSNTPNLSLTYDLARELGASVEFYTTNYAPESSWMYNIKTETIIVPPNIDVAEIELLSQMSIDLKNRSQGKNEEKESENDEAENEESDDESESEESDDEEPEEKKTGKKKTMTEKRASDMIGWFEVSLTGVRDGEVIVGVSKGSKKAIIKLHGSSVKPRAKDLNAIRDYPHLWKKFLVKLGSIPFFNTLSLPQRDAWLTKNETEKDTYIGERDDQWLELIQPGDGLLVGEDIDPSDIERLMEGNPDHPQGWWKQEDIIEPIPAKPGSKARRHTLFFNPSFWRVANSHKIVSSFDGVVFDVFRGEMREDAQPQVGKIILVVDDVTSAQIKGKKSKKTLTTAGTKKIGDQWIQSKSQEVAFIVDESSMVINWINILDLIKEILGEIGYISSSLTTDLELIRLNFVEYTAASYKSLIQKLIRFRARMVELMSEISGGGIISTQLVLLMSMGALAINPGSFVPDIQRYVTGLESLAKRLAVIILEDSSTEDPRVLLSLLSGALLAQRVRTWRPSRKLLKTWFLMGLDAWSRKVKYNFKIEEGLVIRPFLISTDSSVIEVCSALLDELRSFGGDLGMTRYIAANWKKSTAHWANPDKLEEMDVMPIWQGVDQHWATGVVYFTSPKLVVQVHDKSNESASTPFAFLFSRLFKEITGYNPRRNDKIFTGVKKGQAKRKLIWDPNDPFVLEMRKAQHLFLVAKQLQQKKRPTISDSPFILDFTLDISWLAGLVGAIDIDGNPKVIITLNANSPIELIAIRRPTRQMTDEGLTPEREEKAKEIARAMLRKGMPLNKARAPSKFLEKAKVFLRGAEGEEEYVIVKGGIEMSWAEACKVEVEIPYHKAIDKTMENALINIGEGIEVGAWDTLDEMYLDTDNAVIRRVLYYISTFKTAFELNRISRDGGATLQSVVVEDVGAYQFLLDISLLFPAALRPVATKPQHFVSPIGPLLWRIRDHLKGKLAEAEEHGEWDVEMTDAMLIEDGNTKELVKRVPKEYQVSSLKEMIDNHERGIKGNFILLQQGLGKCLAPSTPVLLWDGSVKKAQDIIIGDQLIGDDSTPREVLSTCRGRDPMYRISQGKGDSYTVNEPHILTLKFSGHKGYWWEEAHHRWSLMWMDRDNKVVARRIFTVQTKRAQSNFLTQEEARVAMLAFRDGLSDLPEIRKHKQYCWSVTTNRYLIYFHNGNRMTSRGFRISKDVYLSTKEEAETAMLEFRSKISDNDILDISVKEYLTLPKNFQSHLMGFKVGVEFPTRPVFLDPYILGAWLGDGSSSGNGVTNIDQPILDAFQSYVESIGCKWMRSTSNQICYSIHDPIPYKTNSWMMCELREYGLVNNKHIPRVYLNNNRETRLQILAGLLDTDGYYADGGFEITQKNKRLAVDIHYLVRSLGFSGVLKEIQKACVKPDGSRVWGTYHQLQFSGEGLEKIPCKLERKQARVRRQKKDALSTSIKVEPVGEGDYCGFTLDGNGRFLLGDFTVTHNTFIVMTYIKYLLEHGQLPSYIIYSLPSSAIMSVSEEIIAWGIEVNLMIPLKGKKDVKVPAGVKITYEPDPIQGMINLIDHEHLRRAQEELSIVAGDSLVIFDEVHNLLRESLKTGAALQISRLSKEFIVLTGTPVIDNKIYRLIPWLEQIVLFEVNERNFWCAATIMVSRQASTGIKTTHEYPEASFTTKEMIAYKKLAPVAMGGDNSMPRMEQIREATDISYIASDREIINQVMRMLAEGKGTMVVAATVEHQERLKTILMKQGIKASDIFLITGKASLFLTDTAVKTKKIHGFKVVITTIRHSTGYTLTYLSAFVSGIYFSNQATRSQLEARINRLGSRHKSVIYIYVHAGVLTYIMNNHDQARSLELAIKGIGAEV